MHLLADSIDFCSYVKLQIGETFLEGYPRTVTVDGVGLCFAFTGSHYRAIRALTDARSDDPDAIHETVVEALVARGQIRVDRSECSGQHGWLGARVSDEMGELIGIVGTRCGRLPGLGTDHVGAGSCSVHDRPPVLRGRGHHLSVLQRIEKYTADPARLDLSRELATQRAMMDLIVEKLEDSDDEEMVSLARHAITVADRIGNQVERITLIEQRYALTAGQVLYLQAVVKDTLQTFITEPDQLEKAVAYLVSKLGENDRVPLLSRR